MPASTTSTKRRPPALEGAVGRLVDVDEVDVERQAADVVGRAFEQQRVADPHHDLVELAADVLVAPVHGERIDAVAPAQAQAAERAADELAVGHDQRLDHRRPLRADPVDERHRVRVLQAEELLHLGAEHHPVALGERHVGELPPEALLAAQHVDDPHAVALEDADVHRPLPDQRRALGHHDLGEELHLLARPEQVRHRVAVRQEARHQEPHGREADERDDDAERRDLEELERREPLLRGRRRRRAGWSRCRSSRSCRRARSGS